MSAGVCYFSLGTKHLIRLCVSLHSLRQHYDGPVTILNGGGDDGVCDRIGAALGAGVVSIPIVQRRRHTAYCTKASLWKYSPYISTLLLDADTTIHGDVTPLLKIGTAGVIVTQFSAWLSNGKMIAGRTSKWLGVKCDGIDVDALVKDSVSNPYPAINTGVIAWNRLTGQGFLDDWARLTDAGWRCPFTDELSCQVLARKWPLYVESCRYNYSPLYAPKDIEPVIVHYHGHKENRPESLPYWEPCRSQVYSSNVAGICEWSGRLAAMQGNPEIVRHSA